MQWPSQDNQAYYILCGLQMFAVAKATYSLFFKVLAMHICRCVNIDTHGYLISFVVVFGNVSGHNNATQTTLGTIADISIKARVKKITVLSWFSDVVTNISFDFLFGGTHNQIFWKSLGFKQHLTRLTFIVWTKKSFLLLCTAQKEVWNNVTFLFLLWWRSYILQRILMSNLLQLKR